ncbi:MAG TPA: leucyl aminopeptidase [Anaeromyxobacteraceae bacterium]|nr:leucyl aminopeptidase [Anaeromyxobacteraceae bacterium]
MIEVELTGSAVYRIEAGLLAAAAFEEDLKASKASALFDLDRRLDGHLFALAREEHFEAKPGQSLQMSTLGRIGSARLLVLGLGPRSKASEMALFGYEPLRMAAGVAGRAAQKALASTLAFAWPSGLEAGAATRASVEGALLGAYRFDRYKTSPEDRASLRRVVLAVPGGSARAEGVKQAAKQGERIAAAVAFARDLVNESPVHCTPSRLAEAARELSHEAGLGCEVRGPKEIASLKMGLFLGVAKGSAEEPRLVKVSYLPRRAALARPLVLVGKAITFDSGGLSLKPTDSMVTMNGDMAGSAAVLAAMKVIAQLAPPVPVHALLGACENMPGGRAYKPSDVLTAYNGKTVEITNTDAEGRLVLGDVLAWGIKTLKPAAILDVATLTGACVVALGHFTGGVFGPDGVVMDKLLPAARAAGEDFWRLPLTEPVKETLKSEVADLRNTGERFGAAISAAHFLQEFTGGTPWAHLDIAGPAHSSKERGYVGKGGTGVAVRTLVEFVRSWSSSDRPSPRSGGQGPHERRVHP